MIKVSAFQDYTQQSCITVILNLFQRHMPNVYAKVFEFSDPFAWEDVSSDVCCLALVFFVKCAIFWRKKCP